MLMTGMALQGAELDSGRWGDAERKIGATDARLVRPGGTLSYARSRRLWTEGVDFRGKSSEFKCWAGGKVSQDQSIALNLQL